MATVKRATQKILRTLNCRYNHNIILHKFYSESSEYYRSSSSSKEATENIFNLDEKTAIVNGGASGIGFAISRELIKKGLSQLTIIDINEEKGERATKRLGREFGSDKVLFFEADVADSRQLDDVYRRTIECHDVPDIIINSAGLMNDTKWQEQLHTNLFGCVIGSLLGLQYMSKSSQGYGGIIVNISSIFGIIPSCGYPLHTMTQFGVCGFSKALGSGNHISRTGVKVFALCPGLTDTTLLANAASNAINERFAKEFTDEIEDTNVQKPDSVAQGLIDILDEAKPGSIWVAENDHPPYEVIYPGIIATIKTKDEGKANMAATAAEN